MEKQISHRANYFLHLHYFQPQGFIALFWKLQMTFTPVYRSGALLKTVIGINCDLTILHMWQFSDLQSVKGFSFYPEQK